MCKLKKARKVLGLTTEDVAKQVGVTSATISRWENGKISISEERYNQLAEVYHCNADDLRDSPEQALKETLEHNDIVPEIASKLHRLSGKSLLRLSDLVDLMLELQES